MTALYILISLALIPFAVAGCILAAMTAEVFIWLLIDWIGGRERQTR